MLQEALAYASQGFYVFPILPGLKRPLTQHGFKEATTNPEQITAWWTTTPTANIGVWWDGSEMCAIDIDMGAPMNLDLPATMTVSTPSGGKHLVYEGRIPSSQSKLAPHVDTRGVGGYTLLPPSIVNGKAYEWVGDDWAQPVPEWIKAAFVCKPEPRTERAQEDIDTPERIAKVRELAAVWPPATEGQGSNDATIEMANRLLDLCSHNIVFVAMWELWAPRCIGEWTASWLGDKVDSIKPGSGRDSAIGCEVYPIEYGYRPDWEKTSKRRARFEPILPRDFGKRVLEFWDPKTKLVPKGGIVIFYGQPGKHKTNLTLTLIFDMMENGARVLYAAGEGSQGVGASRVPAHAASRGMEVEDIEQLAIVQSVPLLQRDAEVVEFLEAVKGFKPNIVVIDTLATATAGLDENSSEFGSLLTDNGMVGRIRSALDECTVIVIAHEGKNAGRGIRGHSGLLGNADAAINVTCEGCTVEAHVTKMRDGEDDFSVYAKVNAAGVPIPTWCEKAAAAMSTNLWAAWEEALELLGAVNVELGLPLSKVTEKMLSTHNYLAKSSEALRKQLEKHQAQLAGYQVGRGKGGAWLYALVSEHSED